MAIKKLLDEISVIPGVTGSCVFDRSEGPLCTDSEANIATDVLLKVGTFLLRMLKMGSFNGLEITGSHYRFDNCTVVSTPLTPEAVLLTICNTQANCSLVSTTAEMLAADMKEQLDKEPVQVSIVDDVVIPDEAIEDSDQTIDPQIQTIINQIEEALAEAIGPVAGMIIQDYTVQWMEQGPPVSERLDELVKMLVKEISDPVLIKEFKDRTGALL